MVLCVDESLQYSLCDATLFSTLAGGSYDTQAYDAAKKIATQRILSFLRRPLFYVENQKEYVAGTGGHTVFLSRYPLREIKSVKIDGEDLGGEYTWFCEGVKGGLSREQAFPITYIATRVEYDWVYRAGDKIEKIEIIYSGGYVAPEQVDPLCPLPEGHGGVADGMPELLSRREMPVDIVYAACLEALTDYQRIANGAGHIASTSNIKSYSLGDYSETRDDSSTRGGLMRETYDILKKYKKVV